MRDENNVGIALTRCYFCGEADKIMINTTLTPHFKRQVDELNNKVVDMEPCPKCKEFMQQGVILITIDEARSDKGWSMGPMPNPYRTGGFFVVRDEALRHILDPIVADWACDHRFAFIEHDVAQAIGLFVNVEERT